MSRHEFRSRARRSWVGYGPGFRRVWTGAVEPLSLDGGDRAPEPSGSSTGWKSPLVGSIGSPT